MKKLLLGLALLCITSQAYAVRDWFVAPAGSDSATCVIGDPCSLYKMMCQSECFGASYHVGPGDTVWLRAGTYTPTNAKPFVYRGYWGNHLAPVIIRNYQNEEVHINCAVDLSSATAYPNACWAPVAFAPGTATVSVTNGSTTVGYVSGSQFQTGSTYWPQQEIRLGGTAAHSGVDGTSYLVSSVAGATSTLTLTTPWTGATGQVLADLPRAARYVWTWGLSFDWNSTTTKVKEHGLVGVTNGSATVNFTGTPGSRFQANPTATVSTNGTAVTWVSGTQFTADTSGGGSAWKNKDILINGVVYVVSAVPSVTSLTLSTSAGVQASVASTLPGAFSNGNFVIDAQGTPETIATSYCPTVNQCILKAPVTAHGTGNYISHYPAAGDPSVALTNDWRCAGRGCRLINNFVFDSDGGTDISGNYGGEIMLYGNVKMYPGTIGTARSYGHGGYYQNNCAGGERNRSYAIDQTIVRPYFLATQLYTTSTDVCYLTVEGGSFMSNGHAAYPTDAFPADSCCGAGGGLYLGATGAASTGCPFSEGGTGSTKTMTRAIVDHNFLYAPNLTAWTFSAKGNCSPTITNNVFIADVDPAIVGPVYGTTTISGNTFTFGAPPGTGSPMPPFTQANYPNNTYLTGAPTSGPDLMIYRPNQFEVGRGKVSVYNSDSSPNITIQLMNTAAVGAEPNGMGIVLGETYKLFNAQCPSPYVCTPILTGTCSVAPCPVTVPATLSSSEIKQPQFSGKDLSTLIPVPDDLGPEAVTILGYPDWSLSVPTATPTFTPTSSATPTATFTRTNTFTPSRTFTGTLTPTNTPTRTNTATQTYTPSRTPTITSTPAAPIGSVITIIPSTDCTVTAPMVTGTDNDIYPYTYVSSPSGNNGKVACNFTIPAGGDGDYYIDTKVYSEDYTQDSFFFDIDGNGGTNCVTDGNTTCSQIYDTGSDQDPNSQPDPCNLTHQWGFANWHKMNSRNFLGGNCKGEGARYFITLAAGAHTLTFRQRDPGTRLYSIKVSNNPNLDPVDPLPTPTPGVRSHRHKCPGSRVAHSHPYSQPHRHGPCVWGYDN